MWPWLRASAGVREQGSNGKNDGEAHGGQQSRPHLSGQSDDLSSCFVLEVLYSVGRMPDDLQQLRPAAPDEIAEALSFALRYDGRRRVHSGDTLMARITAERLVAHLERSGFVLMKRPPAPGHQSPSTRRSAAPRAVGRPLQAALLLASAACVALPGQCRSGVRPHEYRVRRTVGTESDFVSRECDGGPRCFEAGGLRDLIPGAGPLSQ